MNHKYNQQHKDYKEYCPKWATTNDVVRSRVKSKSTTYLPMPNPHDTSQRNKCAYDNYLKRALYYNFTQPTQATILGSLFRKPLTVEQSNFDYLEFDIDGSGIGIKQQARAAAKELTETSRGGFFIDYTLSEPAKNRREEQQLNARPVAIFYKAKNIINWEMEVVNSVRRLSKVVLTEYVDDSAIRHDRERVIRIEEGVCHIDVYNYKDGELISVDSSIPTSSNGSSLDYIPFQFVGGVNNDECIDDALLYDLSELNISHYQSSADYEDFRFKLGQIQPFISGVSQADTDRSGGELQFGSGVAWVFGEGATASLLQAQPNSANMESMQHKEAQAKAIGAKLLNPNEKVMSAEQSSNISASETASISSIVDNLESAYENVFQMMLDRVQAGSVEIEFSREFVTSNMTPDELRGLSEQVFKGVIPDTILFDRMRQTGMTDLSDEELRDQLDNVNGLSLESRSESI